MMTRRQALRLMGYAAPLGLGGRMAFAQPQGMGEGPSAVDGQLTPGPFHATRRSLEAYRMPEWYRDAKFGIWSHWGPQSGVEAGDWYARRMYEQGSDAYKHHVATYGHPSKVGYKDLIPMFKGAEWDPEHLMDLYQKAGAKYFFSMGVHHDNFDLWNSKYQPRWNSVTMGPKTDIVGRYREAARKRGLRFGVSEHLSNSFDWFATAHTSDVTGSLTGIPYDGVQAQFADLYHDYSGMPAGFAKGAEPMGRSAPDRWKMQYFRRIKDLLDQHQPDLLYTDGGISFEEYGQGTVAELYNVSARRNSGNVEAIYFSKESRDCGGGTCALDRERGVLDEISAQPWQTDTCIGDWHYRRGVKYKTAKKVIDLLVDIVSKNGNLLLNFPLPNSGKLDAEEMVTLEGITRWMQRNGEGIYESRPWKLSGEGPALLTVAGGGFNESKKPDLGAQDVRFTTKGPTLYAFVQGWPEGEFIVKALGTGSAQTPGKIEQVEMLGWTERLKFVQGAEALRVTLPKMEAPEIGSCLRVRFA